MRIPSRKKQSLLLFFLLVVTVSIGFFLPVPRGSLWGYLGKGGLFLFVFVVFYVLFFSPLEMVVSRKEEEQVEEEASSEAVPEGMEQKGAWRGFGEAFQWYAQEFLAVIRNAIAADYAGLYLHRGGGGLEVQVGENDRERVTRRVVVSGEGVVDRVSKQRAPVMEGELPVGTSLEGLGDSKIRSFLGVPLVWNDEVVGVLALGSEATENFGEGDKDLLMRCGGLLAEVMVAYHRGLRWEADREIHRVYFDLGKALLKVEGEEDAVSCFVQHVQWLFSFDRFTFCVREGDEGTVRYVHGHVGDVDRGTRFSLDGGLNGWVLKRSRPLLIPDMEEGDRVRPRYFQEEDSLHGLRSFLGIPLGREEHVWGCLSLESRDVGQYSERGKEVLATLVVPLQAAMERIHLSSQLRALGKDRGSSDSATFEMD